MPNIIEQQDLLKGLPDDRLATLMQNPTGDIPPFLVAAEAQRRQSIREQFSGGPQESVVDTLTKQLSNVPQNIQAPAQQPPQMPQMQQPQMPQEMGGVAALQQGMRAGGYVRRYNPGGLVDTSIYSTGGSPAEQMAKTYMMMNPGMTYEEAIQRASIGQPLPAATVGEVAAAQAAKVGEGMSGVGNYSVLRGNQLAPVAPVIEEQSAGVTPQPSAPKASPYQYGMTGDERRTMPLMAQSVDQRDPTAGKKDTSLENQAKTDMTVDEYKAYLERIYGTSAEDSEYIKAKLKELYAADEPSSWEKSQKWFAAAQAAIQPGQSDMQAVINALSALGGGFADERAAERAGKRDLEEALIRQDIADRQAAREDRRDIEKGVLDYRISEMEGERAQRSAAAKQQIEALKWQSEQAMDDAKILQSQAADYEADLNRHISDMKRSGMVDDASIPNDPTVIALTKKINELNTKAQNAMIRSRRLREAFAGTTGSSARVEFADGDTMGYLD